MIYTEKKYTTNEDNNIIRVRSTTIVNLHEWYICYVQVEILYKLQLVQNLNLYITYIFFLYMSDEGCFTFIIHHFAGLMSEINQYFKQEGGKSCHKNMRTS